MMLQLRTGITIFFFLFSCYSVFSINNNDNIEKKIDELLRQMTLSEKVGQMNQINGRSINDDLKTKIKKGEVGSILNIENPNDVNRLQEIAINESRLKIPLLIARDVIHGYNTIFPIPLAQAATFNPEIVEKGSRVAAIEASANGIRWTFAPMMDISRDPRWGRIAESFGEDTYLASTLSVASVKGFQGDDLSAETSIAACAKHYVGYGAAEGGRDYNSTNIPIRQLRNVYLPPFKAAVNAGCATIMTSFNDNDGIPCTGNGFLLKTILRNEWGFDGVVVSDWNSVGEMISHGYAKDRKDAAYIAANNGLDMDMVSNCYNQNLERLVEEGMISTEVIDNMVRNILRLKFKLGLFENPYLSENLKNNIDWNYNKSQAKLTAEESIVLLKNGGILPFQKSVRKIALIGPMANSPHDQLGTWAFDGDKNSTITPFKAIQENYKNVVDVVFEPILKYSRDNDKSNFNRALEICKEADVVVICIGEEAILSGEAHSLANLNLQGAQSELIGAISKTGKPIVLVVMAGRPLTIGKEIEMADAVLYTWHPGTMGGEAIADILFGKVNPSGKLPVTFPKAVGQIPIYYNHNNTGRPASGKEILIPNIPLEAKQTSLGNNSFYLDAGHEPLFHFGYGLSYSKFLYSDIELSDNKIEKGDTITIKVKISNISKIDGQEVIQLYVRDLFGSIARPVKELKGFKKINLKAGESKIVKFSLATNDLAFYGNDLQNNIEYGDFHLWIGPNSNEGLKTQFKIISTK